MLRQTRRLFSTKVPTGLFVTGSNKPSIFNTLNSLSQHGFTLKYPKIITIGNQSAGKTSLTEAMCGINGLFEKKTGMATKRPTIITLIKNTEGDDYIKIGSLNERIYNIDKAKQRLLEENEGDITEKPLELLISSSNIEKECVFIDLPGFISATKIAEDSALPVKIRDICLPYITDSTNIKMIVMSATEDPALSYALKLVKKYNQMENAIGVFTKIDMIVNDKLQARPIIDMLNDRSYIPHVGIVGVKLRSAADIASNKNISEMLQNEVSFIDKYNLNKYDLNLGVPKLMEMISNEQIKRISYMFPTIKTQVTKLLDHKRKGHGVIKKLIETEDIHDISVELERIITDLHPLSPIRVTLEKTILINIRKFVKSYISDIIKRNIKDVVPLTTMSDSTLILSPFRLGARANRLDLENFTTCDKLTDYLVLGETNQEISWPELTQTVKDNLAKGILSGFVQVVPSTSTDNKVQFVRDIQRMIVLLSAPDFTRDITQIVTNALKECVVNNSSTPKELLDDPDSGTAEFFFIHIFDMICERSGLDDLNNSLIRMIRREGRPYIDYNDLVTQAYKRHLSRQKNIPAIQSPGILRKDTYPLALHMYSAEMFEAYMDEFIDRISHDLFRMLAVNLLNPIIITTIEASLKSFKHKDFSKQEKLINEAITLLETQLNTIESLTPTKSPSDETIVKGDRVVATK